MNAVILWLVKLTGLPVEHFYFKKEVIYEEGNKKSNKLKKGALLVSNHTSVYDFPLVMFSYLNRNIRVVTAEVIYEKGFMMKFFMNSIGGIKVDRKSYDFTWMSKLIKLLKKNKVGLIYPESRIPKEEEKGDLIEFKPSYVYIALESGVPIIPLYTNGIYGKAKKKYKDHAKLVVGKPIQVSDLYDDKKTEKENIEYINDYVKNKIRELGKLINKEDQNEESK